MMQGVLPARDNPFAVDRVLQIRYRIKLPERERLLDRIAQMNYRAAIVGQEGAGKTTLLEDLAAPLAARGFRPRALRLTRSQPRFDPTKLARFLASLSERDIVLLDGAEQLGRWAWYRFLRRLRVAAGLIITVHSPGRLPTAFECRTSPALCQELVRELVGTLQECDRQLVERLFAEHRGNIRDVFRSLYDCWSARNTR